MTFRGSCVTVVLSMLACLFVTTASASAAPTVSAVPAAYGFGTFVQDGDYSFINDYVTLEGTSPDPVTIGTTSITGADAGQFSFNLVDANYCQPGKVLNQGDQCFVDLAVNVHDLGAKSATLVIQSDVAGGETDIPLTATVSVPATNAPVFAGEQVTDGLDDGSGSGIEGMSSGDISGDGFADIVAGYQMGGAADNQMGYLKGTINGSVDSPIGFDLGGGFPGTTAVGDFNGDNHPDALAGGSGEVSVFLNDGSGNLVAGTPVSVSEIGLSLAVGDYNDDHKADFAVTSQGSTQDFQVLLGNGDGTFQPPITNGIGGDSPVNLVTADFEGDGSSDLGLTDYETGGVVMLKSDGDGTFTELDRIPGCGCENAWALASSDLNGDGRDDLVATLRYQNEVATYIAHADGSFDRRQTFRFPLVAGNDTNPIAVSTGDLNGDGDPDAVTGDYLSDSKTVLVGNGDGTFSFGSEAVLSGATGPHATVIASFDGDIRQDIAIGGQTDGSVSTFRNDGQPGQMPSPTTIDFPDTPSGYTSVAETVTLTNQGGTAPLVVTDVATGGGSSNDFQLSGQNDCLAAPILVGNSCSVQVAFKPVGPAGFRDTTLTFVTNNESDGLVDVPLTGDAVSDVPTAAIVPATLTLDQTEIGKASASKDFVVTNGGFVPVTTGAVTLQGLNPGDFSVTDGCNNKVLQPDDTCTASVTFTPAATGDRFASILVESNVLPGPLGLPVNGVGKAKPVPPTPTPTPKTTFRKKPRKKYVIRTKKLKQVKVAFRSSLAGSKFQCRIDSKRFSGCRSPKVFRNIKPGKHVIKVRALKSGKTGKAAVVKFKVVRKRK